MTIREIAVVYLFWVVCLAVSNRYDSLFSGPCHPLFGHVLSLVASTDEGSLVGSLTQLPM